MSSLISKIGLGTVQFGLSYGVSNQDGITPYHEVDNILKLAANHGIQTLDTASAYGESEKVLGEIGIQEFEVVSKFINITDPKSLEDQLSMTLKRLNTKHLYAYLAHRPLDVVNHPHVWDKLLDLREKGIIKKIGYSFSSVQEYEAVVECGFLPDLIQIPYNYFDKRFSDAIQYFKENSNTEIHVRSVFLQGLLLMDTNKLPVYFDPIKEYLESIKGEDLPTRLLKYVLKHEDIDKVIIGINTSDQLVQNIESLKIKSQDLPDFNIHLEEKFINPALWQI